MTAARCELILGVCPSAADDPAGFVVAIGELARMGAVSDGCEDDLLAGLADAVSAFAPTRGWSSATSRWTRPDACSAAAGESRAGTTSIASERGRKRSARPAAPPEGVWCIPWLEEGLALHGTLLPYGLPPGWLGADFEVFGLPIGPRSRLDYALRWHGERPAVLWEVSGPPVELTAPLLDPRWSTVDSKGEVLLHIAS